MPRVVQVVKFAVGLPVHIQIPNRSPRISFAHRGMVLARHAREDHLQLACRHPLFTAHLAVGFVVGLAKALSFAVRAALVDAAV